MSRFVPGIVALWGVVLACPLAAGGEARDEEIRGEIRFNRDIRPILSDRCFKCHGPAEQEGGLRLDLRDDATGPADSGAVALRPGKPEESELLVRVSSGDESLRMPQDGDPLSEREIALLRDWIRQGAVWERHWSFVKPTRPRPPRVAQIDWAANPIDPFILARLEAAGMTPSPEADRATLIRRLSLDLCGLPPTVQEVLAFESDQRPDAYERLVDRLLASPRFGERWARPWLDAARYGDSNGYQHDNRREVWAWRDWVIRAFNADMPFDRFTTEQLAGDLLPGDSFDSLIATGFSRNSLLNIEAGTDLEEERTIAVVDRTNTAATVWLGLTLECAQCHEHKYDPFSQREYYGLYAFFNNTEEEIRPGPESRRDFVGPKVELPLDPRLAFRRELWQEEVERAKKRVEEAQAVALKSQFVWERLQLEEPPVDPKWTVLKPTAFTATGGVELKLQEDLSLLATAENPATADYFFQVETLMRGITAFKLEVLPDPSLPMNGLGRGDRSNFVLSEFRVNEQNAATFSEIRPIRFARAEADFSQQDSPVEDTLDGLAETGWAVSPQLFEPHQAIFVVRGTVGSGSSEITLGLYQRSGRQRTIGRFRLSATTDPVPAVKLPDEVRQALATPEDERTAEEKQAIREHYLSTVPALKAARLQLANAEKRLREVTPDTTLVMRERSGPRTTRVFDRGDFRKPGEAVQPHVPAALHDWPDGAPKNRLGLSRWLVDAENPLTARVTVNRFWQEIFGRGLVESPEDFGAQGIPPTHPELLDWLAVEFAKDWSVKRLLRTIVLSRTYRQDSRVTSESLRADPHNELYARGPRLRLSAEAIRDNALAISGLLSDKLYGPPVFPYQPPGVWNHIGETNNNWEQSEGEDQYRRALYTYWRRTVVYPSFVAFDAPSREMCVVRRSRSNTPLQALTLMNDPAYMEAAGALAKQIMNHPDLSTPADRVAYAFRRAVSRPPSDEELEILLTGYREDLAHYRRDRQAARTLATQWAPWSSSMLDEPDFAAWLSLSSVLLNLDETINKN